ncbi:MAG: hypothetical protein ACTSX7_08000 [Alphaproteobacteria bacterium]
MSSPKWGIRLATDPRTGAGHLARCRAIAAHLPGSVQWFGDEDTTPDSLEAMIDRAKRGTINAALVDSYAIAHDLIDRLARQVFTVQIADDGKRHGQAAIIVPGLTPATDPALCAGPQFAPLAPAYGAAHDIAVQTPPHRQQPPHILVAFGARDSANCTAKALDAIAKIDIPVQTTIVLGRTAPHIAAIANEAKVMSATDLLVEPADMIALYAQNDLAIGAPGVSFLERLCCGLPSLLLCQNPAQQPIAAAASRQGLAECPAGDKPAAIAAGLAALLSDPNRIDALRQAGLARVDGRGAGRLAQALESARQQAKI